MDLLFTLRFAEQIARQAGERILATQTKVKIVAHKDRQDIVTNADLEAERFIIAKIRSIYPDHGFYSEEQGKTASDSPYQWIIDPIDGTKEFLRRLSLFNTCFSLEKNGIPQLGVVYQPSEAKLYSAALGIGSFEDGSPCKLSEQVDLQDSFVYAYLPNYQTVSAKLDRSWSVLKNVLKTCYRLRGIAEEVVAICWVASGKAEAFLNLNSANGWYDIAAGLFIAREAGAKITIPSGGELTKDNFNQGYLISNGKLHSKLIEIING